MSDILRVILALFMGLLIVALGVPLSLAILFGPFLWMLNNGLSLATALIYTFIYYVIALFACSICLEWE